MGKEFTAELPRAPTEDSAGEWGSPSLCAASTTADATGKPSLGVYRCVELVLGVRLRAHWSLQGETSLRVGRQAREKKMSIQ